MVGKSKKRSREIPPPLLEPNKLDSMQIKRLRSEIPDDYLRKLWMTDWLNPLAEKGLPHDALNRVISFVLRENGIPHKSVRGDVIHNGEALVNHHWIYLFEDERVSARDEVVIDFEMHKVFRDGNPFGRFKPGHCLDLQYIATAETPLTICESTFHILTGIEFHTMPSFERYFQFHKKQLKS